MKRSLPVAAAIALVAVTTLVTFLPSAVKAQSSPFRETIEVRLVEVDVVVTDGEGKRVRGLTADDFEILEGRRRQKITNFAEYGSAAEAAPPPRSQATPEIESTARAAPRPPQSLVVLMDTLPRETLIRSRAFEQLDTLLTNLMQTGDRVSIVFWLPGYERTRTFLEPSSDREAVMRAVHKLAAAPMSNPIEETLEELQTMQSEFQDDIPQNGRTRGLTNVEGQKVSTQHFGDEAALLMFRRKTAAIQRLVTSLSAGREKKSLLYVSNRYFKTPGGSTRQAALQALAEVTKAANAGGVTLYAIAPEVCDDPQCFEAVVQSQDALANLTISTGGLFDMGPASMQSIGTKIDEDVSAYYSIAYQARSDGKDRERSIVVKAKNPGYRIRARQSFVEKSKDTAARDTILSCVLGGATPEDLTLEVGQGEPKRTGRDRWLLPIVVKIPSNQLQFAQERSESVALVRIMIVAANGISEVTKMTEDDLRVVAGRNDSGGMVTYTAQILSDSRGSRLSIGVLDRRSGRVGARTIDNRGRFR